MLKNLFKNKLAVKTLVIFATLVAGLTYYNHARADEPTPETETVSQVSDGIQEEVVPVPPTKPVTASEDTDNVEPDGFFFQKLNAAKRWADRLMENHKNAISESDGLGNSEPTKSEQ
jgi:hypothetical protein